MLQAYESSSQSTRKWFADASNQHPAGAFDTAYAKRKLQERHHVAQLTNMGDLLMLMMAYQKMLAKEVRDDRKTQSHLAQLMLASKSEKIKLDQQAIAKGMQEAKEKSEIAMNAATTSLVTGIVSGVNTGCRVYFVIAGETKYFKKRFYQIKNQQYSV